MRQFPVAKINALLVGALLLAPLSAAVAQTMPQQQPQSMQSMQQPSSSPYASPMANTGYAGANPALIAQQQAANAALTNTVDAGRDVYLDAMRQALNPDGAAAKTTSVTPGKPYEEQRTTGEDLGNIKDPTSARYKSDRLADEAEKQRQRDKLNNITYDLDVPPPAEIETLQLVNEAAPNSELADAADDPVVKDLNFGMRRSAMREAAMSYGARGGLAKQSYEIMERMKSYDPVLDKVFNFRQLLIKAPSGMLIEPPIVKESLDALVITNGGDEAAVAKQVLDINKRAKIVSAPRDWRQYLIQIWGKVPPPPRVLWPKTAEEQADWNRWVAQGWKAGVEQAKQIFEMNTNRLVADYNGMVRYKVLVAEGKISEPFAMQEDRGVTGDKNQMRVGDSAIRITGPSQFLIGADLWKPADR